MKQKSSDLRQKQIIEAAQRLICKYGSEHLTVKRISAEVGISEPAIYRYFKSKKSILAFLISHIENIITREIRLENNNEIITLEIIEEIIQKHFSSISKRDGMAFQVIAEIVSLGDKELNKKTAVLINKYIDQLSDLLKEGIKSGSFRSDIDPEAAALLLFSMIQSLENIWALNNHKFDIIKKYESMWKIFCASLVKR